MHASGNQTGSSDLFVFRPARALSCAGFLLLFASFF
jgi:hypothetical protein